MLMIFLILQAVCFGTVTGSDGLIRSYINDATGSIARLYTDGTSTMTVSFDKNGRVFDCDYWKNNNTVAAAVLQEALKPGAHEQHLVQLDIARLIRQCRRFLRKMNRESYTESDDYVRAVKDRFQLLLGYEGTRWCSMYGLMANASVSEDQKSMDKCCQRFHNCHDTIPEMTVKYNIFNYRPWSLKLCSCAEKFRSCLKKSKDSDAKKFGEALFSDFRTDCFIKTKKEVCSKWDQWFTQCLKYEKNEEGTRQFVEEF